MEPVGEELERLARLQLSGDITEAEYEALKERILSGLIEEDSVGGTLHKHHSQHVVLTLQLACRDITFVCIRHFAGTTFRRC